MTIYVDRPIFRWRNQLWCHLFSEDIDALHAFAAKLGLRRSWFQEPPKASWPHYDIVQGKRLQAIELGAIAVSPPETLLIADRIMGVDRPERRAKLEEVWVKEMLG